ncbi:MAG: murein peptide amidase A, partial [Polaromonas sp.]|nr:murein peptide amidase A [Polaromonas sp.]
MHLFMFAALLASLLVTAPAQAAGPCDEFVRKLPNVKRSLCEAARLEATPARSVRGQTLWKRDIQPDDANLRVLVLGAIHGDELSSASVALHWIQLAEQTP